MANSGSIEIPEAATNRQPESTAEVIDKHVITVARAAAGWVTTSTDERVALLAECRAAVASVAREWVEAACTAKGITLGTPTEGEEWQSGPWVTLRNLRLLERSLRDIAAGGLPKLPGNLRRTTSGQVSVPVFPTDNWDRALFTGFSAEVWMEPGLTVTDVIERQAWAYRGEAPEPAVSVVLGAGNISSIAPTDMLYELFANLRTVVLKMNPVNEYLGPIFERGFAPLIRADLLRIVYGGVPAGNYLTEHPDVSHIHMTGSDKTHDAIVFGTGERGVSAKKADTPATDKSISAELGNVTPVIVVPGPWSDKDLAYQAKNLAVMLTHNAGFNCIATRVLVQSEGWQQRGRLLDELAAVLETIPPRQAYYPGAAERLSTFVREHETARMIGDAPSGSLPWTLISGLDSSVGDDICFTTESFTSLMAEVGLPESDPAEFLDAAVEFCNTTVWGSLGVSLIVHPKSLADPGVSAAMERALEKLAYGTIAINHWTGFGFVIGSSPWGAHPGHDRTDIQSGTGVVHNTYLLSGVQKTIVRGPWRVTPKPTWFPDHRTANEVLERLTYFEASPSLTKLTKVITASLRG
ncbi:MAG TPA: aldehyde dehydrogenase [Actinobacteria bacterium]|nr:aldehyde dehydrogenase [Actinomycetota bacterium]